MAVHLEEVDVVRVEPPQAVLDGPDDPPPRAAPLVTVGAHGVEALGGEDHFVPPALDGPADDLLAFAVGIHVRRVDEVDTGLQCPVDDSYAVVVVRVPEWAEHHGPETLNADLDAGASELSIFHL